MFSDSVDRLIRGLNDLCNCLFCRWVVIPLVCVMVAELKIPLSEHNGLIIVGMLGVKRMCAT